MSDTPGGPDWFQTADGKWHAPVSQKKNGGCFKWFGIGSAILLVLIVIIVIAASAASNSNSKSTDSASHQASSSGNPAFSDVAISKCDTSETTGDPEAVLTVTNHSSKMSNYLLTVAFNKSDGSQIDTGDGTVQTLAPGQTANETVNIFQRPLGGIFTCKLTEVTRLAS